MDYGIKDLGYSLFQEALGYVAISRERIGCNFDIKINDI